MNEAWNIEWGGYRECHRGHKKRPHVPTRAVDPMDLRTLKPLVILVSSSDLLQASPYLHNRESSSPRNERICLVILRRTLHRPSCKARGCGCRVRWELGKASRWRNLWCRFCNHPHRRWWEGLTCWNCLRGSKDLELCHHASLAQSVKEKALLKLPQFVTLTLDSLHVLRAVSDRHYTALVSLSCRSILLQWDRLEATRPCSKSILCGVLFA